MTVRENLEIGCYCARRARARAPLAGARLRAVSRRARQARRARRRAVGRPAADGRDRPRADGAAAAAAARRAVARPVADDGADDVRRDPRASTPTGRRGTARRAERGDGARHRALAPTCSRRAASSPKARPTRCSAIPTCGARTSAFPRRWAIARRQNHHRRQGTPRMTRHALGIIVGSNRRESINRRLALALAKLAADPLRSHA